VIPLVVELYECRPLRARLTERGCAANAERYLRATKAVDTEGIIEREKLRECDGCPGVLALARGARRVTVTRTEDDRPQTGGPSMRSAQSAGTRARARERSVAITPGTPGAKAPRPKTGPPGWVPTSEVMARVGRSRGTVVKALKLRRARQSKPAAGWYYEAYWHPADVAAFLAEPDLRGRKRR
jgi:hypothetical protein